MQITDCKVITAEPSSLMGGEIAVAAREEDVS